MLRSDSSAVVREPPPPPSASAARKSRVAFQVDSLDRGGLEKGVYDLATHLDRRRFEVDVLVIRRGGWMTERLRQEGVPVFVLDEDAERYRQLLLERQIDVVNTHYSHFGFDIALQEQVPLVETLQNTYVWWPDRWIEGLRRRDAAVTAYVATSRLVAQYSDVVLGIHPKKIHIIPNGFNVQEFERQSTDCTTADPRRELGLSASDFVFVNPASFYFQKAQLMIVRAMRQLVDRYPMIKVLFLGRVADQEYYGTVRQYVVRHGLEGNALFCGFRQDVYEFYKAANAFLLPSFWEGWSVALSEALYCQLPVVVTDVGCAPELVQEHGLGLVVKNAVDLLDRETVLEFIDRSDVEAPQFVDWLAVAMEEIYCHYDAWKKRAQAGREVIAQRYSIERTVAQYQQLFAAITKYGRRPV